LNKVFLAVLFAVLIFSLGSSQGVNALSDGTVKDFQKINNDDGGIGSPLDAIDHFGRAVEHLGDLDGDGVEDIAVGAYQDDDGGQSKGAVYILFMKKDGTVKSFQKISDTSGGLNGQIPQSSLFGWGIANIDDLDGDGVIDLAVGATGDNDGSLWILFMNNDGTVKSFQKTAAINALENDRYSNAIANLGDLDGDDVQDLAVGEFERDDGSGAVWILFMNSDGTIKDSNEISNTNGILAGLLDPNAGFGFDVDSIGDLDGDGVEDLAVGAHRVGSVYILFMNSDGTAKSFNKITPLVGNDNFGISVANMGDLDGDGVTDLAVGEENDNDGGDRRGAIHIFFLKSDGSLKSSQKISQTEGNFGGELDDLGLFGWGSTSIGDLNMDGSTDLAVGNIFDGGRTLGTGAVWILFLNPIQVIGGELIPIDSTSLILANTQSFSWMIPVVLSIAGIGLFVVARKI